MDIDCEEFLRRACMMLRNWRVSLIWRRREQCLESSCTLSIRIWNRFGRMRPGLGWSKKNALYSIKGGSFGRIWISGSKLVSWEEVLLNWTCVVVDDTKWLSISPSESDVLSQWPVGVKRYLLWIWFVRSREILWRNRKSIWRCIKKCPWRYRVVSLQGWWVNGRDADEPRWS